MTKDVIQNEETKEPLDDREHGEGLHRGAIEASHQLLGWAHVLLTGASGAQKDCQNPDQKVL